MNIINPICPSCQNTRFIDNGRWCGGRCFTCQDRDYPSGWKLKPEYKPHEKPVAQSELSSNIQVP